MSNQSELDRLYAISAGFRAQYMEYDRLKHIKEDLRMLVARDNSASEGGVMTLLGASGSGKTQLINSFVADYPRQKHAISHPGPEGRKADRATVVVVNMPDTGVKSVLQATYEALTEVELKDARRYDLESDIGYYAAEQQTKLIIFEEGHETSVDETSRTVRAVARLLKRFSKRATFSMLIVGTEAAADIVLSNRELHRRHLGFHTIKPMDWNDRRDQAFFMKLLKTWDKLLQEGFAPSGLGNPELAAKIALASGGVIGWAALLLERAGYLAARDVVAGRTDRITEPHLQAAHQLLGAPGPNPFVGEDGKPPMEPIVPPPAAPPVVRARGGRRAEPDRNFRP